MPSTERAKIVFDATSLRYLHTGLGQFSYHLLQQFAEIKSPDAEIRALVHPSYAGHVPQGIEVLPATSLRRHSPVALQQLLFPACDLWHMTTENTKITGVPSSAKVLLTIHGLHFLDEEDRATADRMLADVQRLVDRAEAITTVSHFTADLVKQKLNLGTKSVEVIANGISFSDKSPARPASAPAGKFIFSVGTFFRRKNFHALLPMMKSFPEMMLVLVGDNRREYGEFVKAEVNRLGLQDQVMLTGEVSEEEKIWLYRNCEAFVFPSISEGFGLPLIEAFYYGKPVFCGRYGSLPEVGGPYACYWDSFEADHMVDVLKKGINDMPSSANERKNYAATFSWNRAAQKFFDLYKKMLS